VLSCRSNRLSEEGKVITKRKVDALVFFIERREVAFFASIFFGFALSTFSLEALIEFAGL